MYLPKLVEYPIAEKDTPEISYRLPLKIFNISSSRTFFPFMIALDLAFLGELWRSSKRIK